MTIWSIMEEGRLVDVDVPDAEAARIRERAFWVAAVPLGLAGMAAVTINYVWIDPLPIAGALGMGLFLGLALGGVGGAIFRESVYRRMMDAAARMQMTISS